MYVLGPLVAFAVIAGLAVVLRWTFEAPRSRRSWSDPEDFGLLTPVSTVDEPESAGVVRRTLEAAGIRSTIAVTRDARITVLVFETELDQARRLVGLTGPPLRS